MHRYGIGEDEERSANISVPLRGLFSRFDVLNVTELLLFTSDVSARGMDYPDVTAVVQVGLPSDRAQYVHRLGRTARAGDFLRARGTKLPRLHRTSA